MVTGTEGYLGSVLAPELARAGHDLVAVDTGFYKAGWLYSGVDYTPMTLVRDVRQITREDLAGIDAVVHMAELSNDPLGEFNPNLTRAVNHTGSVRLATLAKEAGVGRFVYMSSCSVYGIAEGIVDENSPIAPQTVYAQCKAMVERDVGALAGDSFSPTFLRNATAFGASPRMRFDLVLNNLTGLAWTTKQIAMNSDGTPWRPLVHALDIAKAIRMTLDAPQQAVHGQVFNVGSDEQNYQVHEIAQIIGRALPDAEVSFGPGGGDDRSYKVTFDRIRQVLPGYECDWNASKGVDQLLAIFASIALDEDLFLSRGFTRLKQLEYLIRTGQVDDELFWRTP